MKQGVLMSMKKIPLHIALFFLLFIAPCITPVHEKNRLLSLALSVNYVIKLTCQDCSNALVFPWKNLTSTNQPLQTYVTLRLQYNDWNTPTAVLVSCPPDAAVPKELQLHIEPMTELLGRQGTFSHHINLRSDAQVLLENIKNIDQLLQLRYILRSEESTETLPEDQKYTIEIQYTLF